MIDKFSFSTPVLDNSFLSKVDNFLSFGKIKAKVIPYQVSDGKAVILVEEPSSISALKIMAYATLIIPLVALGLKIILRCTSTFHLINPEVELGKGLEVSQETLDKVSAFLPKILNYEKNDEIIWHSTWPSSTFSLKSNPHLTFKKTITYRSKLPDLREGDNKDTKKEFDYQVKVFKTCLEDNLNLLVMPRAKMIDVNGLTFIAQETQRSDLHASEHERDHMTLSNLEEAIAQLAILISKTQLIFDNDLRDHKWNKIPVLDRAPEFSGQRRIELDMDIVGSKAPTTHNKSAVKQQEIRNRQASFKRWRDEAVETYQNLMTYYENKAPLKKSIEIDDLNSLGLNLEETKVVRYKDFKGNNIFNTFDVKEEVSMQHVATLLIETINDHLKNAPDEGTVKHQRFLHIEQGVIMRYSNLTLTNDFKKSWLKAIGEALVAQGHIFSFTEVKSSDCVEFKIQA